MTHVASAAAVALLVAAIIALAIGVFVVLFGRRP